MKNLNILIIEDSEDDALLLLHHLKREGYSIYSERVETPEATKNALTSHEWDIVLSDFQMPEFSGLEAFELVQKSGLELPFIIISGTIGEETAVKTMQAGINDYILKDNLRRLIPSIETALREASNRKARQQAEDKLRKSENLLRLAVQAAGLGVWSYNFRDLSLESSDICKTGLGLDLSEELSFQQVIDMVLPEDKEICRQKLNEAISTGKIFESEFRVLTGNGEIRWFDSRAQVIYDDNGQVFSLSGITQNITERKKAENALRESEENYRALVEATAQVVWTLKGNREQEEIPQWWLDLTGQTVEEAQGWGRLETLHPDERDGARNDWQAAYDNKTPINLTHRIRRKDGRYGYFSVRAVPVFNHDGSFRQWIGTFNDITEHKLAEEALHKSEMQLIQAQKLESIGRLAGGIAHDFNNMLTAINGYAELTLAKLANDDPLRQNLEEIKKAGERSAMLTRQLLVFSRKQVLKTKVLDINHAVIEISSLLKRLIGEDIALVTYLYPNIAKIEVDPGMFSQVILNLAVNSRDAMPDGGKIIIKTATVAFDEQFTRHKSELKAGYYVMLSVTDTGVGISDEEKEFIFEPFYTTKEVGKGTGLGLSTVYGIVKQAGGYIEVESEVGKGTTFKVFFPCFDERKEVNPEPKPTVGVNGGHESILLVEDEELVRKLNREVLELCGYRIYEANNGVEALDLCQKENLKIDLLMTDVVMPKMGGCELAEILKKIYPQLKVLFTSGYTDDSTVKFGNSGSNPNFLQKPFSFNTLAAKIREILDSKGN